MPLGIHAELSPPFLLIAGGGISLSLCSWLQLEAGGLYGTMTDEWGNIGIRGAYGQLRLELMPHLHVRPAVDYQALTESPKTPKNPGESEVAPLSYEEESVGLSLSLGSEWYLPTRNLGNNLNLGAEWIGVRLPVLFRHKSREGYDPTTSETGGLRVFARMTLGLSL